MAEPFLLELNDLLSVLVQAPTFDAEKHYGFIIYTTNSLVTDRKTGAPMYLTKTVDSNAHLQCLDSEWLRAIMKTRAGTRVIIRQGQLYNPAGREHRRRCVVCGKSKNPPPKVTDGQANADRVA